MGGTSYSGDAYVARHEFLRSKGVSAFEHHDEVRAGRAASAIHPQMSPFNAGIRESRDSEAHPEALPLAIFFDVTGSMHGVPRKLQEKLTKLMTLCQTKGYVPHPAIMIGAVGDYTSDRAPFQVGQFESGIEIDENLSRLFLECGGGGQNMESYELALYFAARHTATDSFEKRGRKGYCFLIGDEKARDLTVAAALSVFGDQIETPITMKQLVAEASEKWEVFFLIPGGTSNAKESWLMKYWTDLLGQNVLRLDDPDSVCELIATTIGISEGVTDIGGAERDLTEVGTSALAVTAVSTALVNVKSKALKAKPAKLPKATKGSGLATV